ncbi:phasin family protein [Variovorax sp. J22G21]|uniref:phasin family protein n=1 Tax=Variovorax fucosicus TaxID=3053517 RepID=UPI002577C3BB|nr:MULTISPECIES: phasin family protein [unclassified Variovorax]MDM0041445.1 phasin family protein [Variovorax sp. J22R193]MDM0060501.1 phasin family protein [Variovorax sp. J22G21]
MAVSPAKTAAAKKAVKPKAAKAPAVRRTGAAAEPVAAPKGNKGEALLRAGLKALGEVRDGVVQRQTRVVETLLGIPPGSAIPSKPGAPKTALDSLGDSLGFRKLEDVFDQRIAAALGRLGTPSAEEFAALREQVRTLLEERDKAAAPPTTRRKR